MPMSQKSNQMISDEYMKRNANESEMESDEKMKHNAKWVTGWHFRSCGPASWSFFEAFLRGKIVFFSSSIFELKLVG